MTTLADAKLAEIARSLAGPRPRVCIPLGYGKKLERVGPHVGVFHRYSEVCPGENCSEIFWKKIREVPFKYGLQGFAAINNALLKSHRDADVHRFLHGICLRPEYLPTLRGMREAGSQPDLRLIFHRGGNLTNLKAVLMVPEGIGCVDPQLIGDLALLINDFLAGRRFRQDDGNKVDDLDLLVEFVPAWELYNPTDVARGMARVSIMFDLLGGTDQAVVQARSALAIDVAQLRFDGLSLEDYSAVVFGLFAHVSDPSAKQILENPGHCEIDRVGFLKEVALRQETLDQFLSERSLAVEKVRRFVNPENRCDLEHLVALLDRQLFTNDVTIFRQYPLIDIGGDKHLIVDYQFVAELLIYGLYWQIFDGLPSGKKREDFSSLWGRLFELYVWDLLNFFYKNSEFLGTDVSYPGGQVDAILDFGSEVVIFEFKASLLSRDAKYGRDREVFERTICNKFVKNQRSEPKALRQLARIAHAVCNGSLQTLASDAHVFPVLVSYEPALESFGMNQYLDGLFQTELGEVSSRVWPLTVMSIDELEEILPYFSSGDWSWGNFFRERLSDHRRVPGFSAYQSLHNFREKHAVPRRQNEFVLGRFDAIYQSIMRKYEPDGGQDDPVTEPDRQVSTTEV